MEKIIFKFIFLIILNYTDGDNEEHKLNVAVYYETLCSDTSKFFIQQLFPSIIDKKRYKNTNLYLFPYGKVNKYNDYVTKKTHLQCQHGYKECQMNAIDACIYEIYKDVLRLLYYRHCMFQQGFENTDSTQCAEANSIEMNKVDKCLNGRPISEILEMYGQQTSYIQLTFVPSVSFDWVFNQEELDGILKDFDAVFCRKFYKKYKYNLKGCNNNGNDNNHNHNNNNNNNNNYNYNNYYPNYYGDYQG